MLTVLPMNRGVMRFLFSGSFATPDSIRATGKSTGSGRENGVQQQKIPEEKPLKRK